MYVFFLMEGRLFVLVLMNVPVRLVTLYDERTVGTYFILFVFVRVWFTHRG